MQAIPTNHIIENWNEIGRKFPLISVFDVQNHDNVFDFIEKNACQFDLNFICCTDENPQELFEKLQKICTSKQITNVVFVGSRPIELQQKINSFKQLIEENMKFGHLVYIKGTTKITELIRHKIYQEIIEVKNPFQYEILLDENANPIKENWSILSSWIYTAGNER